MRVVHDLGIHAARIEPFGESYAVVSVAQAVECAVVRVEDHGLHQGIYGRRNARARRFTAGGVGSVVVAQVLAQEGGVGTLKRAGAVNARVEVVSDALAGVNGELVRYGEMISQTENKELKQKLKQIRNDCEMSQEKLYQIAREKSYYVPAAKATDQEISHVKNILAGISTH